MKSDFTRTGQRTIKGRVVDAINGAKRFYKNNYSDGWRQDAIDCALGKMQESTLISRPSFRNFRKIFGLSSIIGMASFGVAS